MIKLIRDFEKARDVIVERAKWLVDNNIETYYSTWKLSYLLSDEFFKDYGNSLYILCEGDDVEAVASLRDFDRWGYWGDEKKSMYLGKMATPVKHKGKGYAAKMIEYLKNFSREQGFETMRLEVHPNNSDVIKIYESCGFKFVKKIVFDTGNSAYFYECDLSL